MKTFYTSISLVLLIIFSALPVVAQRNNESGKDSIIENPVTRGHYLQSGSTTGIIIRWRTGMPSKGIVNYGQELNRLEHTTKGNDKTTEHIFRLTNLLPGTKYYYRIHSDNYIMGDSTYYFITSPGKPDDNTTRIWALGDFGTGDVAARKVKLSYLNYSANRHTDVWLMLGDIAYYYGKDHEYQEAVFDDVYNEILKSTVAWPTPGNHDMRSANSGSLSGPYFNIFSLPVNGESGGYPSGTEAYYSFDYGNIHFVSLDSEDSPRTPDGAMVTWLKKDLEINNKEWLIVFFHDPPYTKGTHDSDMDWDSRGRMIEMRENIIPVLESYGADLILSGHSHVYERSHLIAGHYGYSHTFKRSKMIVARPEKKHGVYTYVKTNSGKGTMYIVCGVGSHKPMSGTGHHPAMAFSSDLYEGSLLIEVEKNTLTGRFITINNKVKDSFSIVKE